MKKKILLLFMIILTLFCTSGCTKKEKISKSEKTGKIYEMISLKDGDVTVFNGIVPKGWNYNIESNWNIVNSSYPGRETIYLSSKDLKATIKIVSQESYVQNDKYQEGENLEYYTTYLSYKNASDYLDYYTNKYYSGSKLAKELPVDDNILKQAKEYNNIIVKNGQELANALNSQGKIYVSASDYETTVSKKQYEYGSNYMECSTAVAANKTTVKSNISELLDSESISWIMPYTIIYSGEDKESFDKYYDDYLYIIANSSFTVDYYALIEYVSSAIVNAYTTAYAEKAKAGLDAMNDYIDSNYSSTSSASTNDKVMEMWDDVIKEEDSYKAEDGTTIKTSIHNDVVAQKGDEIYVGSKAGIPIGFNELPKSY